MKNNLLCRMTDDEIDKIIKEFEDLRYLSLFNKTDARTVFRIAYIIGKGDGLFEESIV